MDTHPKRSNRLTVPSSPPLEDIQEFFYCSYPDCDYKSNWEENVGTHERDHSPTFAKLNIPCQVCPQVFGYLVSFLYHMSSQHSSKLFCPSCLFLGEDLDEFKAHMIAHILTPTKSNSYKKPKEYCCGTCSKKFTRIRELFRHQKKCSFNKPVPVRSKKVIKVQGTMVGCDKCSFKTLHASSLRTHRRTHSSEKPFKCLKLGCVFKTRWARSLKQHQGTCRQRIVTLAEPPDEAAVDKKKKEWTAKTLTEKRKTIKREVLFTCTICSFRTKWKASIRNHRMVHEDYKPFWCSYKGCKYQTKWPGYLKKHSRLVHRKEPATAHLQTKENLGVCAKKSEGTVNSSSVAFACMLCEFIGDSELSALKHACQHRTVVISLNRI